MELSLRGMFFGFYADHERRFLLRSDREHPSPIRGDFAGELRESDLDQLATSSYDQHVMMSPDTHLPDFRVYEIPISSDRQSALLAFLQAETVRHTRPYHIAGRDGGSNCVTFAAYALSRFEIVDELFRIPADDPSPKRFLQEMESLRERNPEIRPFLAQLERPRITRVPSPDS